MFVNRYDQARPLPIQIEQNVIRLNRLSNQAVDIDQLRRSAELPVEVNYILKAQTDNLKKLSSVIRNDKQIERQLDTLRRLVQSYEGNSRDELQALLQTLASRITTAREDMEIQSRQKQQNLALSMAQRREKKEEKDKKLEAQRIGRRLAFTLNTE